MKYCVGATSTFCQGDLISLHKRPMKSNANLQVNKRNWPFSKVIQGWLSPVKRCYGLTVSNDLSKM